MQTQASTSSASTDESGTRRRGPLLRAAKQALRKLEAFQGKHSTVGDAPVFDNGLFPWVGELEAAYPGIRGELDRLLENPGRIPAFHQISPDQARISKGDNWKTFAFYVFGERVDENCAVCPHTAATLDGLPKLQNAWFSILAPGYRIPPHRGPTRCILRAHLGLRVPEDSKNCWIRVDTGRYCWEEGKCLVFDDTYEHEVQNNTDERRVVLFMDFDRPMDRLGGWVNGLLVALIRKSAYVREPVKNLAAWNRRRESDVAEEAVAPTGKGRK